MEVICLEEPAFYTLLDKIRELNSSEKRIFGGVIVLKDGVWKFCHNPTSIYDDTRSWDTLVLQHYT